jgi:hypothetical protein
MVQQKGVREMWNSRAINYNIHEGTKVIVPYIISARGKRKRIFFF